MKVSFTSIRIRNDTKQELEKRGKYGESHNDIIERLLKYVREREQYDEDHS